MSQPVALDCFFSDISASSQQLEGLGCFRLQATCCVLSAGLQPPIWSYYRGLQSLGSIADNGNDWSSLLPADL